MTAKIFVALLRALLLATLLYLAAGPTASSLTNADHLSVSQDLPSLASAGSGLGNG